MKIDRHNYEEYFILYLDNELSSEDRRSVEEFAKLHPDLQEELDLLPQSKFTPDETITFANKEDLYFNNNSFIHNSNYEEWLLLYIDNELSPDKKAAVEKFAEENPIAKTELALLRKTQLQPETIEFPGKESLYRKEEKVRPILWWRIAAAAVLLIGVSTTAIMVFNKKTTETTSSGTIATTSQGKTSTTPDNSNLANKNSVAPANDATENTEQQLALISNPQQNNSATDAVKGTNSKKKDATETQEQSLIKNNEELVVQENTNKPDNNLPKPLYNPNVINNNTAITGSADAVNSLAAADPQQNSNKPTVTTPSIDTYNKADGTVNEVNNAKPIFASNTELVEDENAGKKSKLRGFLRKVTRTFEKKTNIDPTDKDDRLLVGGLAIRLK